LVGMGGLRAGRPFWILPACSSPFIAVVGLLSGAIYEAGGRRRLRNRGGPSAAGDQGKGAGNSWLVTIRLLAGRYSLRKFIFNTAPLSCCWRVYVAPTRLRPPLGLSGPAGVRPPRLGCFRRRPWWAGRALGGRGVMRPLARFGNRDRPRGPVHRFFVAAGPWMGAHPRFIPDAVGLRP